ncbi:hypothetical protein BD309DRAFT_1085294 [Dichomitus squalens]|nr:hypothetical protein BD309DRAFT_1085294 [Dichomitus squalens]
MDQGSPLLTSTPAVTTTATDVAGFADAELRSAIDSLKAGLDGLERAVQSLSEEKCNL